MLLLILLVSCKHFSLARYSEYVCIYVHVHVCVHVCLFLCACLLVCSVCIQMSQHHCSVLLQCYVELKNSINVEDHVLDYLYSKSVITKSLRNRIRHDFPTADAKVQHLLLLLC